MKKLSDKFEVVWNTKHRNDIVMRFKIPVDKSKKWWQFWKKESQGKTIIELADKTDEEIIKEVWVPVIDKK